MKSSVKAAKGFTLIELLIVIGIIAVLATIVVLTLNPAELLRQARDSTRLSDMATLRSAMALYQADVIQNVAIGDNINCTATVTGVLTAITGIPAGTITTCGGRFQDTAATEALGATSGANRGVTGTGWIPVNFSAISSGSPISNLPIDPTNTAGAVATSSAFFYAYRSGPLTCATTACTEYEVNVNMESSKFSRLGTADVETGDGGNDTGLFEVGTDPGLDL